LHLFLKFMSLCTLKIRRGHQTYMQGQICIFIYFIVHYSCICFSNLCLYVHWKYVGVTKCTRRDKFVYLFIYFIVHYSCIYSQIYAFMYPGNTSGSPNVHAGTNLYLFILLFTIVAFVSQIYVFMYPENTSGSPNVHAGTNLCIYLFILLFTIVAFILKFMPLCTLKIRRGHQMYTQGQICIFIYFIVHYSCTTEVSTKT